MTLTTHSEQVRASASHNSPEPGPKARIARSTSQLNYVPHTTCHVGGAFRATGMRVAYLTGRRTAHTPSGRKQASGLNNKIAKARNGPNSAVTSRSRPDKNNNDDDTPPQNKQATTPVSHNTGVLFYGRRAASLRLRGLTSANEKREILSFTTSRRRRLRTLCGRVRAAVATGRAAASGLGELPRSPFVQSRTAGAGDTRGSETSELMPRGRELPRSPFVQSNTAGSRDTRGSPNVGIHATRSTP
jgi:hypothetical protein